MRREFLQLCHTFDWCKIGSIGGWFLSEKLDGVRAIWLPDTKGHRLCDLPMSNVSSKRIATGLWTRYANPIYCPSWWSEKLPKDKPLDGELWVNRGQFQQTVSTVRKHEPIDSEWKVVSFKVLDCPSWKAVYSDGRINGPNLKKNFKGLLEWCIANLGYDYSWQGDTFENVYYRHLGSESLERDRDSDWIARHEQLRLPIRTSDALNVVKEQLATVVEGGGEGLVLRHPMSIWEPKRSDTCLKVKSMQTDTAKILELFGGEGRLQGMTGSILVVNSKGVAFTIGTGFSDEERIYLKVGQTISYHYRELSNDGVPKEARFDSILSDS